MRIADSVIRKFRITAADGKTYEMQHSPGHAVSHIGHAEQRDCAEFHGGVWFHAKTSGGSRVVFAA